MIFVIFYAWSSKFDANVGDFGGFYLLRIVLSFRFAQVNSFTFTWGGLGNTQSLGYLGIADSMILFLSPSLFTM